MTLADSLGASLDAWKAARRKSSFPRAVLSRALLVVLTLWGLAMIVPDLQRVFASIGSFGLSTDNNGLITDVQTPFDSLAQSPAAQAGLAVGDHIDLKAMRCLPRVDTAKCASLVAVFGGLGGAQDSLLHRHIALIIDSRDGGPPRTVTLASANAPLKPAERIVLFADTAVGCVVIVIAFWLVWTRPGWTTWGLFLYIIWINPGQSYTYYALLQSRPALVLAQEILEAVAEGAAFAGLLIFALRFPEDHPYPRWRKVEWAVALLGAAFTIVSLLSFGNICGFRTERITDTMFLAGYAVDAMVLLILVKRRHSLPVYEKPRMSWAIWGCAIGLPTYIFAELCQSTDLIQHLFHFEPSQALIGLLYLPNGVLAYFASQAVWQRRVVKVSIPLRHGTVLVALSLAMSVPIIQLDEKLAMVQESARLPSWIWPLVAAPVFMLLLDRLHHGSVELIDRAFNRHFHVAHKRLEEAGEAILRATSLNEIDRLLVESTVRILDLASGTVFRNEDNVFRRTHSMKGWDASMKSQLDPQSDAVVVQALEAGEPLRVDHSAWTAEHLPTGLQAPCLFVPVKSGVPEATAIALFGPHASGNDIDDDEREMLDWFAARAATGYERVITGLLRKQVTALKEQLAEIRHSPGTDHAG